MSLPIALHRLAQREFDDAVDWYESRRPGWGTRFILRVQESLARIAETPLFFAEVEDGIREARVRRFPYCVYFRAKSDHIWVVSVFHTSRNPETWQHRQ